MRLVRFGGAMSLDGYIAGPSGEYDWITMHPDFDFSEHMAQFDTFLIGRKTFEAMRQMGSDARSMPGTQNFVFSRTLRPADYQVTRYALARLGQTCGHRPRASPCPGERLPAPNRDIDVLGIKLHQSRA